MSNTPLAIRLERVEAEANAAFVEARAALAPTTGAVWREFNGAFAMFDGAGSPITQTFGLGLHAPFDAGDVAEIEHFFFSRGASTSHEVCAQADPRTVPALEALGYRVVERSNVLYRSLLSPLPIPTRPSNGPTTRVVGVEDRELWARTAARGWSASADLESFMLDFGALSARTRGFRCFAAELNGKMIATGGLAIHRRVGLLAGASTAPEFRGRGAQSALLAARLAYARTQGCDIAMVVTAPNSTSQANAERAGFTVAYGRAKHSKSPPSV